MREADSVSGPPAEAAQRVRILGSRTFVRADDTWMDTAFDPDLMETVKVAFLSDDYFALAASDPELGAAFALGPNVIALSNGTAYQVVPTDSSVPPVEIQLPQDLPETGETAPASTAMPVPENTPPDITLQKPTPTPISGPGATVFGSSMPCVSGMLPLALLPLVGLVYLRRYKK
jgi:hypothetical protein